MKAKNAGNAALAIAKKATTSAKAYSASAAAGKHSPLVPVAATVTSVGLVTIGAVPVVAAAMSSKQAKAVDKHTTAIASTAMSNKRLQLAAAKAEKSGKKALAASGDAARAALAIAGKKGSGKLMGKTAVGAAVAQELMKRMDKEGPESLNDAEAEFLGECLGLGESGFRGSRILPRAVVRVARRG